MKFFKIFVWCAFLISVATFMGCSARRQMVPNLYLNTSLSNYPVCVFSVESHVSEDINKELNELRSEIFKKVSILGVFRSIQFARDCEEAEGCLLVVISISDIKKVSGAKRFFLGAFAGRANMKTDITFIDAAAQETIGSYTVTGESGGTGLSGGTGDAIRKTSEAIVEIIQENYRTWRPGRRMTEDVTGEEEKKEELPEKEEVSSEFPIQVKVTVENASIRLEPTQDSQIIHNVPYGAILIPEEKIGEWFKVSIMKGAYTISGYIHQSFVEAMN
jgi:hypothetical protein